MYPNEAQSVSVGQTAFITCRAIAGFPEPSITWVRRDRRPLAASIRDDGQGSLTFEAATADDAGEYECTARNAAGSVSATSVLNVHQRPVITRSPDVDELRLTVGDELRLECSATGVPPPQVVWYDSQQTQAAQQTGFETRASAMPTGSRASMHKYRVRQEDEGTYMCVAKNSAGTDEKYVFLTVEPKRGDVGE